MIWENIELFNTAELIPPEDGGAGLQLLRFPQSLRPLVAANTSCTAVSGSELRFVIEDGGEASVTLRSLGGHCARCVLYYGSIQAGWQTLYHHVTPEPVTLTFREPANLPTLQKMTDAAGLPFSPRVIRLLLADEGPRIAVIGASGNVRPPKPEEVPPKCLLFYGSSITHGSLACAPNGFFSCRTARLLGWDAQNQGHAGQCRFEEPMAQWLANKGDWDAMVAELGINVLSVYTPDEYRAHVRRFIDVVHGANPDKYLFLIDLFYCSLDFTDNPKADVFRAILTEETAKTGSQKVVHINGLDVLNGVRYLSADLAHPTFDGSVEISDNLARRLAMYLD